MISKVSQMSFLDNIKNAMRSKKDDENPGRKTDEISTRTEDGINEPDIPSTDSSQNRNYTYLDNLIKSCDGEIVLDCDISWQEGDKHQIFIEEDNIIIDGNGHTIDARKNAALFNIGFNKNVTIKNITLKNSRGGITDNGNLTIVNSILKGNSSRQGGAIYVSDGGSLKIMDSKLSQNTSTGNSKGGGAICGDEYAIVRILNCDITSNSSEDDGGAIFADAKCDLFVINSCFKDNSSHKSGGAIYKFLAGFFNVNGCRFTGNSSKGNGGALHNHVASLNVANSQFSDNHSDKNGGSIASDGDLTISESSIVKSSASDGGAIFHENGNLKIADCDEISENVSACSIIRNSDEMQIHNSIFRHNRSKNIITNENETKAGIFNAKFIENNVEMAVITSSAKSCTIERPEFAGNLSSRDSLNIINDSNMMLAYPKIKEDFITILNNGTLLIKDNPQFTRPKIENNGEIRNEPAEIPDGEKFDFGYLDRLIHECGERKITLEQDICLEDYEKHFYEGGIELDIDGLVIDGNGRTIDGAGKSRIFLITSDNITLKNITFKNGQSHKDYNIPYNGNGGLIRVYANARLTIENCRFQKGNSEVDGGAIYNKDGIIDITGCEFSSNSARNGGTIYNSRMGKLNIADSKFTENTAKSSGGAIYNYNPIMKTYGSRIPDSCYLKITESQFSNNNALEGGAIENYEATLDVSNSSFISNSSTTGGGLHSAGRSSKISVENSTFRYNTAKGKGGAIFLLSVEDENKNLKGNAFEDNKPEDIEKGSGSYIF